MQQQPASICTGDPFQDAIIRGTAALGESTEVAIATWGLGKWDRWDIDQSDGALVFTSQDPKAVTSSGAPLSVRLKANFIGSFSHHSSTWLWAWANPSLTPSLSQGSLALKEYGNRTGLHFLAAARAVPADSEGMGWEMLAAASQLCPGIGCVPYRAPQPDGSGASFLLCDPPEVSEELQALIDKHIKTS